MGREIIQVQKIYNSLFYFSHYMVYYIYMNIRGDIVRKSYIDVMKGLGIILVLFGHRWPRESILIYIYSFHMPMFFLISGYLFKTSKYNDYKSLIVSKSKFLLIPYCIFAICSLILKPENITASIEHLFVLKGITVWNSPLWFLMCLFVVEIIHFTILKISKNRQSVIVISLLICGVIGYLLSKIGYLLPFKFDTAFVAVLFYGIGNLLKSVEFSTNKLINSLVLTATTVMTFALSNNILSLRISMNMNIYGNYIYFILIALMGTVSLYTLSILINKSVVLEYLGRNSLIILSVHFVIFAVIDKMISATGIPFPQMGTISAVIITFITLLICVPIIYIVNKYLPFILGKSKSKTATTELVA